MRLTTTTIKTLTLPPGLSDKKFFDDTLPGFAVRVRPGGSRKFVVMYDFGAKTRTMTLGAVGTLDLGEARKRAKDVLAAVRLGRDPANEKIEARERASETFGALLPRYLTHKQAELRARSFKEVERHLVKYARPLHPRPVAAIDRRAIDALVTTLAESHGLMAARTARGSLSGFFTWLVRAGLVDGANPVTLTNMVAQRKRRERLPTDDELREIWAALGDDEYGDIVRLLIYTGARKSEIGSLAWDEIDFDAAELRLPAERMKGDRPHVIPLSAPALAILEARRGNGRPYIFSRAQTGVFPGWSWRKELLDGRIAAARKAAGIAEPMPGWTLHDLRRYFSTVAHDRLGIPPHIVEACLAHVGHQAGVAGTYNKAIYLDERRRALTKWADHVDAVVTGSRRSGAVVKLRKR
jgi:integrase